MVVVVAVITGAFSALSQRSDSSDATEGLHNLRRISCCHCCTGAGTGYLYSGALGEDCGQLPAAGAAGWEGFASGVGSTSGLHWRRELLGLASWLHGQRAGGGGHWMTLAGLCPVGKECLG